jgi:hypothetical protein
MRAIDPLAPTFGLPLSLRVPIAAKDLDSIEGFVGPIARTCGRVQGTVGAVLVNTSERPLRDDAPLWGHPRVAEFERRLFPPLQAWVHVDYSGYRAAWTRLGMPQLPHGEFLDHVQNRRAIRLRNYSHPYVLLCPVSRQVNTSAGVRTGAEGMERAHLESANVGNKMAIAAIEQSKHYRVAYADPFNLTKMLNIVPGTQVLDGVRQALALFYP